VTARSPASGERRTLPLVAMVLLVLVAVALVARAGPYTDRSAASTATPTATGAAPQPPAQVPDPRGEQAEDFGELPGVQDVVPANVLVVVTTVLLVVLMGVGVLSLLGILPRPQLRRRRSSAGAAGEPDQVQRIAPELAAAVDQALDRLDRGEARDAVVACWLLLIQTATAAGSALRPSETSREYAERLSAEQLISAGPLARLAELYREARFSRHQVGPEVRAEARRALGVLQTELRSGVRL